MAKTADRQIVNGETFMNMDAEARQSIIDLRGELNVYPDSFDNLLSPTKASLNGLKWEDGVLKNVTTDSKTFFQLRVGIVSESGSTNVIKSLDVSEAQKVRVVGYCSTSARYIQIRHNGSTRDLYINFPIKFDRGAEVIIEFDIVSTNPNIVGSLQIQNVSAVVYAANKWSASIESLHHLNIPDDIIPEFSQTSSSFTVKIAITEQSEFVNIPDTSKRKTAAQVVEDLPDNATYLNDILTIQMGLTQSLMYDYENNRFVIAGNTSSTIPKQNHLVLVESYYGNVYGDWVNKVAYKNQLLKPSPYLGGGTGFSYVNRTNGTVDIYITTDISFVLESGSTFSINKQTIVEQLGSAAVIEGDAVKITLPTYRGLFFNAVTRKLFIGSSGVTVIGAIPLLFNAWTNLYGSFMDFYFRNKIVEADTHFNELDSLTKLPDYYVDEVNDTANKLSKLPTTNFNYLAFTDIHYSYPSEFTKAKLKQFMETVKKLADGGNIDAVLFLGDAIEGGAIAERSKSDAQLNELFEELGEIRKPVLCLFGNHDNNMYDFGKTESAPYRNIDHYIVMNEWKNKAVLPFGISSDYYYKDFPNKNIRVIVANTCDYRESVDASGNVTIVDGAELIIRRDQVDAIADMMNESQYDMVVFAHGLVENLFSLISKYNSRETYTKENGSIIDFSGKTHKILLYHTGHYHNSAMEHNEGYNINILSTSCASMATVQQTLYSTPDTTFVSSWEDIGPVAWNERVIPRTKNTANETCYDIVSIGDGKINKIGFGASTDGVLNLT